MRLRHFESLRPVCPVCRVDRATISALTICHIERRTGENVDEGILLCSDSQCAREYPIIDGIPILVGPIRAYLADQQYPLLLRDDFGPAMESLIGDCTGPGTLYDTLRQRRSSYVWDHYGDFDPEERSIDPRPGMILRLWETGRALTDNPTSGLTLDLGCGPGRTTFAAAAASGGLTLGIDLNLSLLRAAAEVLRTGRVRYSRRRLGMVYDRRDFAVPIAADENVDFWACDATALPLEDGAATHVVALNVLDSTGTPTALLHECERVLAPGGTALFACPYDWSPAATPVEHWLGGHSQRGSHQGDAASLVRALLTPGAYPQSTKRLRAVAEADRVPWGVRLHERSTVQYATHVIAARADAAGL